MSKINIGDIVRFISDVGGGVVTRKECNTIYIEDKDGFEIPTLEKDCIVVKSNNNELDKSHNSTTISHNISNRYTDKQDSPNFIKGRDNLNLYLIFVPNSITDLSRTNFDSYLINDSNYHISYLYSTSVDSNKGKYLLVSEGIIEPNQKIFIEELSHTILGRINSINLQFIVFSYEKAFNKISPMEITHKIDAKKFLKQGCFCENDFFDNEAMLIELVVNNKIKSQPKIFNTFGVGINKETITYGTQSINNNKKSEDIIVIDLHIEQLLDDTSGLQPRDMLQKQIDIFTNIMNKNKTKIGQKIVFIHGKGNRILRNSIERELRTKHRYAEYQDASFTEYGYGATMVTIHTKDYDNRRKWR